MNYKLRIGDTTHEIETTPGDEGGYCRVVQNDRVGVFSAKAISPNHLRVHLDGRALDLFVARSEHGTWVWVNGRARLVQDADKVDRKRSRGPGSDTPGEITPPTPASVVRIMVEIGQEVTKGVPVVAVSAMKMEITLSAPYDGTVTAINTEVGAQVSPGEILVELEPAVKEPTNE